MAVQWGYNNLQWYGSTCYHKFNDQWHISFEAYDIFEHRIPNANNPTAEAAALSERRDAVLAAICAVQRARAGQLPRLRRGYGAPRMRSAW